MLLTSVRWPQSIVREPGLGKHRAGVPIPRNHKRPSMLTDVESFLAHLTTSASSSPNTIAAYRNDLHQFVTYLESARTSVGIGNLDSHFGESWSEMTPARIAGYLVFLRDKGYATTTVARKIAAVKSFFHFLSVQGIVQRDPTESLESPRIRKSPPKSLDQVEVEALIEQRNHDDRPEAVRDVAILHLLWATGMRVSELVALNVADVDANAGYVRCIDKRNRERVIPLGADAQDAIGAYLSSARPALAKNREDEGLFVNQRGERLTRQGFWLILKGIARAAGLSSDVTPQMLRHSFAFHQLGQRTDVRSLQELLGHRSITTTQVYVQAAAARGEAAPPSDAP